MAKSLVCRSAEYRAINRAPSVRQEVRVHSARRLDIPETVSSRGADLRRYDPHLHPSQTSPPLATDFERAQSDAQPLHLVLSTPTALAGLISLLQFRHV